MFDCRREASAVPSILCLRSNYSTGAVQYLCSKRRAEKGKRIRPSPRHTPLHAGLSPQSGSGWNVLLHGQLARPSLRPVGDANSSAAGRCSAGATPRTLPHRRLGRSSRPYALPADLTGRRCQLSRSLARDLDGILERGRARTRVEPLGRQNIRSSSRRKPGPIMPLLRSFQAVSMPHQWPRLGEMDPGLRRGDEKHAPEEFLPSLGAHSAD